ncbi:MAG: hypothetical protein Q7U75_17345 [Desulfobacterales bacterium]|nr:hypothetical protein [Desulfobacterales bacterium]
MSATRHDRLSPAHESDGFAGSTDLLNNWSVALAAVGLTGEAREKPSQAIALLPGCVDARVNAGASAPSRVTTHPLRRQPVGREYEL